MTTVAEARGAEPAPAPVPPAAAGAEAEAGGPAQSTSDWLRAEVAARAARLRRDAAEAPADVHALLASLEGDEPLRIRQLPTAAQEALALTQNPLASVEQLVTLVKRDPTLTLGLLREANSAYYGTGTAVVSVKEAIDRVGLAGVRNQLMASVVQGLLCRPGGETGELVKQVWEHMVRTAPLARRLAPCFDAEPEEAYVIGLLHDVGKLVLFDRVAALRAEKRRALVLPYAPFRAVLAELHEPLGGLAALAWGLGDPAARAIAAHHRQPPPKGRQPLGEVACLAERLDHATRRAETPELERIWADTILPGTPDRVWAVLQTLSAPGVTATSTA